MQPIGVAILGLHHLHSRGWAWNVNHVDGFRLIAVADADERLVEEVVADLPGVRPLSDYDEAVASPDVSVATVLVPHDEMPDVALSALRAGKHLIVEKPCATDAERFRPVVDAVCEGGQAFTAPYLWRYDPVVLRAREIIQAGEIGRIAYATGRINAGGPGRYMELSPWMARGDKSGGGPLRNLGVHWVDALSWLVGEEPATVTGQIGRLVYGELDIEDHACALIEFDGGAQAVVETSYVMPAQYPPTGYDFAMLLKGTEGYIEWSQREDLLLVCSRDGRMRAEPLDRTAGGWTDAKGYGGANGLSFLADFGRAIRGGGAPRITARDAFRALAVVDAAYESAERGAAVALCQMA